MEPAATAQGGGGDKEPHVGTLPLEFRYNIANTLNLDAQGLLADNETMALLRNATTFFVERVVAATCGDGDGQARGLLRGRHGGRHLRAWVPPGAVWIRDVFDVACADTAGACQEVAVSALLILSDAEAQDTAAQRLANAISHALAVPGVAFPGDGILRYRGPAGGGPVLVHEPIGDISVGVQSPEVPEDMPREGEDDDGSNGVPLLTVGIGATLALVLPVLAVLLVRLGGWGRKNEEQPLHSPNNEKVPSQHMSDLDDVVVSSWEGGSASASKIRIAAPTAAATTPNAEKVSYARHNSARTTHSGTFSSSLSSSTSSSLERVSEVSSLRSAQPEARANTDVDLQNCSLHVTEEEDVIFTSEVEGEETDEEVGEMSTRDQIPHLHRISEEQLGSSNRERPAVVRKSSIRNDKHRRSRSGTSSSSLSSSATSSVGKHSEMSSQRSASSEMEANIDVGLSSCNLGQEKDKLHMPGGEEEDDDCKHEDENEEHNYQELEDKEEDREEEEEGNRDGKHVEYEETGEIMKRYSLMSYLSRISEEILDCPSDGERHKSDASSKIYRGKSSKFLSPGTGSSLDEQEDESDTEAEEEDKQNDKDAEDEKPAIINVSSSAEEEVPPPVSHSELHLRAAFRNQSTEGEDLYVREQYAMAIACFNDARFALLTVMSQEREGLEGSERCADLKDQINLALLLERTTDCHVQQFSWKSMGEDEALEDSDISHINYRQAATLISEATDELTAEITWLISGLAENNDETEGREDGAASEINALNDLLNEATLSSARIFMKQGYVSAKFSDHYLALHSFGDSIAAWEKAANIDQRKKRETMFKTNTVNDDPLDVETHDMIYSDEETHDSSRLTSQSVDSLKNTTHLKALSTALEMANSHYAVAIEAAIARKEETTAPSKDFIISTDRIRVAIHHHLQALKLIRVTRCLRAASKKSSPPARFFGAAKRVMAANRVIPGGGKLTTHGRDLSTLMNHDSKDIVDDVGQFLKRCTLLMVQQQVCISHACSCLGFRSLSNKWLSKALDGTDELRLSDSKEKAKAILHVLSMLKREDESNLARPLLDRMSLFRGGSLVFTKGCTEEIRLFIHFAFAALEKGLPKGAKAMFNEVTEMYDAPTPPGYYDELLHALNAQIIIQVQEGDMNGALIKMHCQMDIVSRWLGNTSLEVANGLHRLGSFFSLLGHHKQCASHLEQSLKIGAGFGDYDALDCTKLLAITYDNMRDTDNAIKMYVSALSMEEDLTIKPRLMNALSFLLIKIGGQSQLATNYLDNSMKILQDDAHDQSADPTLLLETMILYGNAKASESLFSEAIDWYDSVLSSNPDKSATHPSNLRAWYNKGLALFQNNDIPGAVDAFGHIQDEVGRNPSKAPTETASVLNAIGNIYFCMKDFATAIEHLTQSLSLRNGYLSPCQRAGTLCNIGSAYYRMHHYNESEKYFNKALVVAESDGEISLDLKPTILCKLAYILYRRKDYLSAQKAFSEAALIGCSCSELDDYFSIKCESYAKMCHQLMNKTSKQAATTATDDPLLNGLDDDKTTHSSHDHNHKDDYEDDSEDDELTPPEQDHTAGPGEGLKVGFLARAGCFIRAARAPQQEEEQEEHLDFNSLGNDDGNAVVNNGLTSTNTLSTHQLEVKPSTPHGRHVGHFGNPPYTFLDYREENVNEDDYVGDPQNQEVTPRQPKFEERLIPMRNAHDATRYSSSVYPWNAKMLTALGVKSFNHGSIGFPSKDRKVACTKALEYLLQQTEACRAEYALEFEGLLVQVLNSKFITLKSLLGSELHSEVT